MPATLIVIDMQPEFSASEKTDVLIGVTNQIVQAINRQQPIVFVEYEDCGSTHKALLDLVKNYPHKSRVTKTKDDGSSEVLAAIRRRGFYSHCLRICGVNANCCVLATVYGILDKSQGTVIEISKNACGIEGESRYDWRRYPKIRNLVLV